MRYLSFKTLLLITVLFTGTFDIESGRADVLRHDPDISGQIIDADTRQPLPGVVVSAIWFRERFRLTEAPGNEERPVIVPVKCRGEETEASL